MTNFTIILTSAKYNNTTCHTMSKNEIFVMFDGLSFDKFQDKLIGLVTREEMHAKIVNTRGNEIFEMRYSPNCSEGICCTWPNPSRLNRFINSFPA